MIRAASSLVAKCVLGILTLVKKNVGKVVLYIGIFCYGVCGWGVILPPVVCVYVFSMIAMIFSSVMNNGKKLPEELFSEEQQNIGWLQIP